MPRQLAPARSAGQRWPALVLVTLVVVTACTGLEAGDPSNARASIDKVIKKGVHALRTQDVDELLSQIPDEVASPAGFAAHDTARIAADREQIRISVLAGWKEIKKTRKITVTLDSVLQAGDSATVVTTLHWDRLVYRADGQSTDTVVSNITHREKWRRTPAGWRSFALLSSQGTNTKNGETTPVGR